MPSYKLYYVDGKGRAELSRLLFTLAGVKFEDVRWTREAFPTEKTKLIFGQIPTLEVDGKQYGQSMAIAGFLAREFGLHGSTNTEQMEADQVLGIIGDIFSAFTKQFTEQDADKKAAIVKENNETNYPKFVGFFEKILKNKGTGFYVGKKLGIADLAVFDILEQIEPWMKMDGFPSVKANQKKVAANEKIAKYLKERHPTEF